MRTPSVVGRIIGNIIFCRNIVKSQFTEGFDTPDLIEAKSLLDTVNLSTSS